MLKDRLRGSLQIIPLLEFRPLSFKFLNEVHFFIISSIAYHFVFLKGVLFLFQLYWLEMTTIFYLIVTLTLKKRGSDGQRSLFFFKSWIFGKVKNNVFACKFYAVRPGFKRVSNLFQVCPRRKFTLKVLLIL